MSEEVRKTYRSWDFDVEEKWLNTMAQRGRGLVEVRRGHYTFEPEEPGSFEYRLLCLRHKAVSDRGRYEIVQAEQEGWQSVASKGKWAYLKRPAGMEPYDILEDADNKRKIMKREHSGVLLLMIVMMCLTFYELFVGMVGSRPGAQYVGIVLAFITMLLLAMSIRISGTLRYLKNEARKRSRYGRF